ncbi:flagellar hook-length control protein FliK [Comamonas testosteroni]|jgi:flagellar hook-length control protein FliK|uniref:flagellar hook-length control protein FliK n=1 Tax=Comamonas testosteroni TaxID=285 RepID=UPI0026EFD1DB|nr:flagellar hook-length control protein FliK [Comamonas testosteroni]WQD43550.1 flagellar hook-length control protein FliK [Comamonas testosteroni]
MNAMPTTSVPASSAALAAAGGVTGTPAIAGNGLEQSSALPAVPPSVMFAELAGFWGAAALSAQISALPEAADGEQTDPSAQESTDLAAADALSLLASFAPTWQPEVQAQLGSVSIEPSAAQKPSSSLAVAALNPAAVQAQRDGKESVVAKLAEQAPTHAATAPQGAAVVALQSPALSATEPVASVHSAARAAAAATPSAARAAQPLMQALSQRIQLQQAQGVDVATVRLDPPQWGSVELRIQHDAGGVQVFIQASHAEVGRQLAGLAEGLRQELQARSSGEASVVVAQGRHSGGAAGQGGGARDEALPWTLAAEDDVIGQALQVWQQQAEGLGAYKG